MDIFRIALDGIILLCNIGILIMLMKLFKK